MTTLTDEPLMDAEALIETLHGFVVATSDSEGYALALRAIENQLAMRGREGGGKGEADRLLIDSRSAFNAIALTSSTEDLVAHDFLDMCTIAQQSRQAIDAYFLAVASPAPQVAESEWVSLQYQKIQDFVIEHRLFVGLPRDKSHADIVIELATRALSQPVAESQGADVIALAVRALDRIAGACEALGFIRIATEARAAIAASKGAGK